jgi:UDP-N-acetylmuramate: L-alanyl-gamma-D-glutamyl-meso-diaminopimelate ligase
LELKTDSTSVPVYEDYGSSRAKALAGLTTIRKTFPDRRMIVLFEPHTFSFRNRAALHWYNDLFDSADIVFIYQPPALGAKTHEQLTQEEIAGAIQTTGKTVYAPKSKEEILTQLKEIIQPNDVILIETSGDLGGAIELVVDFINANFTFDKTLPL